MINNLNHYSQRFLRLLAFLTVGFVLFFALASTVSAEEYLGVVLGVKESSSQGRALGKNKVTVGNVEAVVGNTVTIEEKKGKKTEVVLDSQTKVVGQGKKLLQSSQIKLKDKIAIISSESGQLATESSQIRKAVKVYVREQSQVREEKRKAVQGIISSLEGNQITLVHQIHQDRVYTLSFSPQTLIRIKGQENATTADLQVGQRIVAIGDLDEEGIIVAKRIHVIPGKATGVFQRGVPGAEQATPSADLTVTPSPTATPSVSLSPTATPTATLTPSL